MREGESAGGVARSAGARGRAPAACFAPTVLTCAPYGDPRQDGCSDRDPTGRRPVRPRCPGRAERPTQAETAADVPPVELHDRGLELGRRGLAAALAGADRLDDVGREALLEELVGAGDEGAYRRRRVGGDDAHEPRRTLQCVQESEHPAPGLAEHVVAPVDAEVLDQPGELALEQLDGPERRVGVGQVVGASVAELVVEDARPTGAQALRGDRRDVVVRRARPAVADHHRRARCSRIEVSHDPVPGAMAVALEVALHRRADPRDQRPRRAPRRRVRQPAPPWHVAGLRGSRITRSSRRSS